MRGCTTPLILWDEWAWLKFNKIIYASLSPAQQKAQEMASKMKMPYGKTLITTPNRLDADEGVYCKKMMDDAAPFEESMYDWDKEKINKYINANSSNDFVFIIFYYKELGLSEEWFNKQCRALNNDLLDIKREILLEWTITNDLCPFSEEQLDFVSKYVKEPIGKLFIRDIYKFIFYKDIDPETSWLIGVDVGGGLSKDSSTITITHPDTLEIYGEFKNNRVDTAELTMILFDLITTYIPNSVLVIERNSYGKSVIDNLLKTPIANRLYWEIKEIEAEKKISDGRIVKQKIKTRIYGINTDTNSRDKMINDILKNIVNEHPEVITSKNVFDDIKNLEYKKSGKIEHRDNEHDDSLFSYLVIRYMIAFGKNLSRFMIGAKINGMDVKEFKENISSNMSMIYLFNKRNTDLSFAGQFIEDELNRKMKQRFESDVSNKFNIILDMNNDLIKR